MHLVPPHAALSGPLCAPLLTRQSREGQYLTPGFSFEVSKGLPVQDLRSDGAQGGQHTLLSTATRVLETHALWNVS